MAIEWLSPRLIGLNNKSIRSSKFLNQMKLAKVFTIYQSGLKNISLQLHIYFYFTRHLKNPKKDVNQRLRNYLNKYKFIHESQSGLRLKHSCQTALVKLNDQWMTWICKGHKLPFIAYGSVVLGAFSSANLDRLRNLQKRAARIKLQADFTVPSVEKFMELRWLPINKCFKYNKAVFTYKAVNTLNPQDISDLLQPMSKSTPEA